MPYLVTAVFVSSVGDWLYRLALPLLTYRLTGSAALTATTYAIESLPYLVLSPAAGVLADRVDRRRLLIRADLASAGLLLGLVAGLQAGLHSVPAIYVVAFALAAIGPIYHPALQALVPVVAGEDVAGATARLQSADNVVPLVAPLAGGVVIAVLGATWALGIDGLSFAISAVCVALVHDRPRVVDRPARRARTEIVEAMRFIRQDRFLLAGAALFACANFAVFIVQANLIYYLTGLRHFAAVTLGIVFAAEGGGALVGALVAPALERRFNAGRVILGSIAVAGLFTLPLLWAASPATVAVACALDAAAGMVTVCAWFSARATRVPSALLGRVVALTRMAAFAAIPAAAVAGGVILDATHDFAALVLVAATVQIMVAAVAARSPLGRVA